MLHVGELVTTMQHDVPVVVCLFNDRGYGVLRGIQAAQFDGRTTGVDLTTPDFVALAQSMGLQAHHVADPAAFEEQFAAAIAAGRPALLDIDLTALSPLGIPGRPVPRPAAER